MKTLQTTENTDLQTLQSEFNNYGARFTPLGLELPEELPLDGWAAIGRKLYRAEALTKWWLGDWAAFGKRKYGDLKEFALAHGISPHTLANYAVVSRAIESSRRRDDLEWSYHEVVAGLAPKEQAKWLERAHVDQLNVADLRKAIRQARGEQSALDKDGVAMNLKGTKAYDDLTAWLKSKPAEFWEPERCRLWRDRLRALDGLIPHPPQDK